MNQWWSIVYLKSTRGLCLSFSAYELIVLMVLWLVTVGTMSGGTDLINIIQMIFKLRMHGMAVDMHSYLSRMSDISRLKTAATWTVWDMYCTILHIYTCWQIYTECTADVAKPSFLISHLWLSQSSSCSFLLDLHVWSIVIKFVLVS